MRVSAPTRTSTFIFTSVLARSIASGLHLTPKKDASRCAPMARYVTESFLLIDFFIFRHHHAIVNEGDTHSLPVPYAVQRTRSHPSNMPDSTSKKLPVRALTEGDCPARSLQSMLITVRITMRLGSLTDSFKVTETHSDRLVTLSILQALSFTAPPHAISNAIQYVGTMSHRKIVKNL